MDYVDSKMKKLCVIAHNSYHFLVGADDVVNLTSEKHDLNAQINHLHNRRKQKDPVEGTGVVPAKYPPKVKLEIFSQL